MVAVTAEAGRARVEPANRVRRGIYLLDLEFHVDPAI